MNAEKVERLLALHEYMPCAEHTPTVNVWWAQCEGCDWKGPRRSHRHADRGDHRRHVAELLTSPGERNSDGGAA